ncbi:GCNT2 transferase, partial [Polyodon spathula]|nr:GCNT2 transferase [Polyodon spathula]
MSQRNNWIIHIFLLAMFFSLVTILSYSTQMKRDNTFYRSTDSEILNKACTALLQGSAKMVWRSDFTLSSMNTTCQEYITKNHFIHEPLSSMETYFPLAYIIIGHKEFEMFARLFRAVYAPQNMYCIHIDEKAKRELKVSVEKLVNCFPNAFLSSKAEPVIYAGSRLHAEMHCMRDLISSNMKWKYVINVCGQDFPLKTNREIIQHLKRFKGKNITPGILPPDHAKKRTQFVYKEHMDNRQSYVFNTTKLKSHPPHNITIYFGSAYYALTYEFVRFVLEDKQAKDLLEWSKDTFSPDEHYWVTINRMPGVSENVSEEYLPSTSSGSSSDNMTRISDLHFLNAFTLTTCLPQWAHQSILKLTTQRVNGAALFYLFSCSLYSSYGNMATYMYRDYGSDEDFEAGSEDFDTSDSDADLSLSNEDEEDVEPRTAGNWVFIIHPYDDASPLSFDFAPVYTDMHPAMELERHYVRDICIYGSGDLKWLIERNSMFANKFEYESYPPTVECETTIEPSWYF